MDSWNWPGLIVVGIGIVCAALALVAAGYGFAGRAIVAGVIGGVCLLVGVLLVLAEHRRVKRMEGLELTDPEGR
ncbi:hypothetical protein [Nocardia sp. NPDC051981]|uniref:hypothetical protein n=1 Tax=Nocardia sp. NPDC051981 TaxID=3155417 RepID=UPI0034367C9E